jgi:fermentation-respiration switch protein FrsA (DUF1100 family)
MLLTVVVTTVIAYAGICAYMYLFQDRFLFKPTREIEATPALVGLDYEDVTLTAADGVQLHGWFVPSERPRAVALYFHGNRGNISQRLESLKIFHRLRLSAFILDYHGYGRSGGRPSEQATYVDAQAAWDYLLKERHIAPANIIVFGRSLGAAVASWLIVRQRPAAAVIESTFTSLPDVAAETYPLLPVRWLTRFRYNTLENLRQAQCPVLIAHSREDAVISFQHGKRLYEAAAGRKDFLEMMGDHNDGFITAGDDYLHALDGFLDRILGAAPSAAGE